MRPITANVSDELYEKVLAFAKKYQIMRNARSIALGRPGRPCTVRVPNMSETLTALIERGMDGVEL